MRRLIARSVFVVGLGGFAMLLGIVTSMTLTPPGRALLARNTERLLDRVVNGQVEVGGISGSFLYDLNLENLVVRDSAGVLLADLPRVHVGYRLPNFLARRFVLGAVEVDSPFVQIIKHANGRMNYEDVLGLNRGNGGGGPSPLILFNNVKLANGTLRIALPWKPGPAGLNSRQADSALAFERSQPGRVIEQTDEGLRRVIQLDDMAALLKHLRIASPDGEPFTLDLDSLAGRLNDPAMTITDAVGRARLKGDSVIFSLERAALPHTVVAGGGAVTWPRGTVLFDFELDAPRADLTDLRWISPKFPAMTGHGRVVARSESDTRTSYTLHDLHLQKGLQQVDGSLVAVTDQTRGLGVRDMDLRVANLDLNVIRAYLDTLPFYGTITGTAKGSGWLTDLNATLDLAFTDAKVPGNPVSTFLAEGRFLTPRHGGLTFDHVRVRRSDIDLGTAKRLAPAITLDGRLAARGTLDGPLRNVTFEGVAEQQDDSRPVSRVAGLMHFDTRGDTLGLNADVDLAPLDFSGIRRSFPSLKAQGELRGHVRLDGNLAHLAVNADVGGQIGQLQAQGAVTLLPPKYGADSLAVHFTGLDLAALLGSAPSTRLNGALLASGVSDTGRAPEGDLQVALGPSRMREWTIDTLFTRVGVHDSVVRLDTLIGTWQGATAVGSGTLGWAWPDSGRVRLALHADSLIAFDSLALALTGLSRDTSAASKPLNGSAQVSLTLTGSLDSLEVGSQFDVHDLKFNRIIAPEVSGSFFWQNGTPPLLEAAVAADSVSIGSRGLHRLQLSVAGRTDSLSWRGGAGIGDLSQVGGSGEWRKAGGRQVLRVDSLVGSLATHQWILEDTASIVLSDSTPTVTPIHLRTVDGSGFFDLAGQFPGTTAPGALDVRAGGLDLVDLYGLLQRDTAGVDGDIGINVHLAGTRGAPAFRGTAWLGEASFGDADLPFMRGVVDYADRRLQANVRMWRTGNPVLALRADLPLDLAFESVPQRQVPGELMFQAQADSLDFAIIEAFTAAVTGVRGTLSADVGVRGTWDRPELTGAIDLRGGRMNVPGLGVTFGTVAGRVTASGDSLALDSVYFTSNGGRMDVSGAVRLENLARPVLALDFNAHQFKAIDVKNFLTLTASGSAHLRGPLYHAVLTGDVTANSGVLYFADLLEKNVVDLSDPVNAALVDTTLIRKRNLGPRFQSVFLDSLRVNDLRLAIGSDFWLRSNEANIQLDGALRVNKTGRQYQPSGTLQTLRGTYTLKIGPVSRDFSVDRGTLQYLGTPDLNANLDITAEHLVRTSSFEIPVVAKIQGTLLEPKLTLTSGPNIQPPIPEVDLVSYLIFGVPSSQAQQLGQSRQLEVAASYFTSAFSAELERYLVSDLGLPVDLIEIHPAVASGAAGSSITQVTAGWQIGTKLFFTLNAGVCGGNLGGLGAQSLGTSLEFRFSQEWRTQLSLAPTFQSCGIRGFGSELTPNVKYQFGVDLLWNREF